MHERTNGHRSSHPDARRKRWALVVPVKPAAVGKSRLAPFAGGQRSTLARAMALDTVSAALACPRVVEVLVVTRDEESGAALAALGATVVPDEPDQGLNAALEYGAAAARLRRPDVAVGGMLGDLPALRADELATALDEAARHPASFVCDADGVGTTLFCTTAPGGFTPRFGPGSRAAHRAAGAIEIVLPDIASVRRDVDTESDLREALALGLGPRTAAAVAALL